MNRKTSRENIESLIKKIRENIPNVTLRTSLIVGFPGETKEQFEELYNFAKEVEFDKLGVFEYSKEDGTPAAKLPEQIHHNTKKSRYNKIMKIQKEISTQKMRQKIGQRQKVLIEDISFDQKYLIGRTSRDVPDIDGIVYIKNENEEIYPKYINTFVECQIVDATEYDLVGKIIG